MRLTLGAAGTDADGIEDQAPLVGRARRGKCRWLPDGPGSITGRPSGHRAVTSSVGSPASAKCRSSRKGLACLRHVTRHP